MVVRRLRVVGAQVHVRRVLPADEQHSAFLVGLQRVALPDRHVLVVPQVPGPRPGEAIDGVDDHRCVLAQPRLLRVGIELVAQRWDVSGALGVDEHLDR